MGSPAPSTGIPAPNLDGHIVQAKKMVSQFAQNLARHGVAEPDVIRLVRLAYKAAGQKPA